MCDLHAGWGTTGIAFLKSLASFSPSSCIQRSRAMDGGKTKSITLEQFVSITSPVIDLEKEAEISASISSGASRNVDTAQKKGSAILNLKCVDAQTGLIGKTLLEFQSTKTENNNALPLPPHKFGTHDVVVLRPNKADLGSPTLRQGVVYRLKDLLITVAFEDVPDDGLNTPLWLEKLTNEVGS